MTFSNKFFAKSPFKRRSVGFGIHQDDPMERMRSQSRETIARIHDKENIEKITEDYKKSLIKKAERKEKKIAKKIAKGSTWGVKRKQRKADRLRKQASEVTEEDVLRMREQNRRDKLFQGNITLASRKRKIPRINA